MDKPKVTIELTDWRGMGPSNVKPFQIERMTNSILYKAGDRLTPRTVSAMINRYRWTVIIRRAGEGDRLIPA